jgi:hypothetical protein
MGKAVRMGVGAALPIVKKHPDIDGIIIGTANGGMEDCIKFLNQIIDYEEGMLTPGNFVQSTPNAIAAQLGLMTANKGYNITHVHRGLSFENALLDAMMMLDTHSGAGYLVGAVDEISTYNYNIDYLDGWYKSRLQPGISLYDSDTAGSIAGEGAAMFLFSNNSKNAIAQIVDVQTIHTTDGVTLKEKLLQILRKNALGIRDIDLLISGENGDNRLLKYYTEIESIFSDATAVIRYKHLSGEFPTSSAVGAWLACNADNLPSHMFKSRHTKISTGNILIYNNYKGVQHAFILISK